MHDDGLVECLPSWPAHASGGDLDRFVVRPHRSMGRGGVLIVLLLVGGAFAALAVWATRSGAWPMVLYAAMALAGFAGALSSNLRSARFVQVIELAPDKIRVSRIGPAAASARVMEFDPLWVRVVELPGPWDDKRLVLRQSNRSIAIGDFLPVEEREELATELRRAITRHSSAARSPDVWTEP